MSLPLFQVDSFTDVPFRGNPAGVCLLSAEKTDDWLQSVASEMNLSETAFLQKTPDNSYNLRYFTPTTEVPLCGHATLASAHILFSEKHVDANQQITFQTGGGTLRASKNGELIELDFPLIPPEHADPPPALVEALGVVPKAVAKNSWDYLIEVGSEEELRRLHPDFDALRQLPTRSVMVTSRSATPDYDFVSRYFAPSVGIPEDPVTGSAHCTLAPYWAERLGKMDFKAYQASPRGGEVFARIQDDRVILGGKAVTIFQANLIV